MKGFCEWYMSKDDSKPIGAEHRIMMNPVAGDQSQVSFTRIRRE
ncbi:MAG TPA: hypothetical protein VK308_07745 [Pyrinomonadaceae bacterium]|nr:hypothetical protein [Pyrinomonadaceae bacterium]